MEYKKIWNFTEFIIFSLSIFISEVVVLLLPLMTMGKEIHYNMHLPGQVDGVYGPNTKSKLQAVLKSKIII